MPNSQRLLFTNRGHGVGSLDFQQFMRLFLNDPYKKVVSVKSDIIVY
ncbi:hypothetical protein ACTJJ0_32465 [Chitinophaga sp. 22321]|uniref:Uncharacterized protein n=1 Tax=Chitinophaga hostae TaxID=2831022 RepID=A0ABS5J968_9BACT|nr:hypothetical protein [Chitinophaga hostae]MBS0031751.1 hypothetical protein [Chitinophaga hostae]